MLVDAIVSELGLNSSETFMAQFLPQVNTNSHILFSEAIDALSGDAGHYWRSLRMDSGLTWGDILSLATEKLFECFSAEFVDSQFEIVDGEQE